MLTHQLCLRHSRQAAINASRMVSSVRRATTATVPEVGVSDPNAYCRDLVQKRDYESFLLSQFYAKEQQNAFLALRAFYIELATVPETVSNAIIGNMRMQFWRDALNSFGDGRPPKHPIALALYQATQNYNLPMYHLKRIVDARDAELQTPTHLAVDSLTAHAEATSSTFLYLLLSMLEQSASHIYSHAASHVGVAQTIATLLRALPYHASRRHMVIPAEITARHGVSQEDVFRQGGHAQGIADAVFDFATVANDHLITAREMFKESGGKVAGPVRPVFLSAVPAALYLERLEKVNFDAFHPSLQQRSWRLPWRIWLGYYKGRF